MNVIAGAVFLFSVASCWAQPHVSSASSLAKVMTEAASYFNDVRTGTGYSMVQAESHINKIKLFCDDPMPDTGLSDEEISDACMLRAVIAGEISKYLSKDFKMGQASEYGRQWLFFLKRAIRLNPKNQKAVLFHANRIKDFRELFFAKRLVVEKSLQTKLEDEWDLALVFLKNAGLRVEDVGKHPIVKH